MPWCMYAVVVRGLFHHDTTMSRPNHIKLPPQPAPDDVFSRPHNSALDTAPTPSDADSPAPSPGPKGKRSIYGKRQSIPSSDAYRSRRMSKASTLAKSVLLSPGIEEEGKPAIPTLLPNIRPAYATPLPVLPMIVLCIVSLLLLLKRPLTKCRP